MHDPTPPREHILTTEQTAQPEEKNAASATRVGTPRPGPAEQSDDYNTRAKQEYQQSNSDHHGGGPTTTASSPPAPASGIRYGALHNPGENPNGR